MWHVCVCACVHERRDGMRLRAFVRQRVRARCRGLDETCNVHIHTRDPGKPEARRACSHVTRLHIQLRVGVASGRGGVVRNSLPSAAVSILGWHAACHRYTLHSHKRRPSSWWFGGCRRGIFPKEPGTEFRQFCWRRSVKVSCWPETNLGKSNMTKKCRFMSHEILEM